MIIHAPVFFIDPVPLLRKRLSLPQLLVQSHLHLPHLLPLILTKLRTIDLHLRHHPRSGMLPDKRAAIDYIDVLWGTRTIFGVD